jgi:hypothetical protein
LLTHFQGPLIGGLFFQRQLLLSFFQVPLRWMVVTPTELDNSIILLPVATPISQWMNESKYKKIESTRFHRYLFTGHPSGLESQGKCKVY